MATVERIGVTDARRAVTSGQALLVCAYEDEAKCRPITLDRALTLSELKARTAGLPRDQEIIFYCG